MPEPRALDERAQLRSQYGDPTNLAKRSSLYAHQRPQFDLPGLTLELLGAEALEGPIIDVGCGPGTYLTRFAAAGGRPLVGLDQSPGMATVAAGAHPVISGLVGDASRLPFPDDVAAAATALHMLYHVPDPRVALRELRRVTRPGGPVVILTNGRDHLQLLKDIRNEALRVDVPLVIPADRFGIEHVSWIEETFGPIEQHDLRGEIVITEPGPLVDYFESGREFFDAASVVPWPTLVERFTMLVRARLADEPIVTHSHSAFFLARA